MPAFGRTFFLLAAAVACAGAWLAGSRGWLQPAVTVEVTNRSTQQIERLELTYTSANAQGTIVRESLLPGQSTTLRFILSGEGSYAIAATFDNGKLVRGGAGYVEPGYATAEVITEGGIASTTTLGYP